MDESKELNYLEAISDYTKDTVFFMESADKRLGKISEACDKILRVLQEIERKIK